MSDVADKAVAACPQCGKRFQVARTAEGKQARCSCGSLFTISCSGPYAAPPPSPASAAANVGPLPGPTCASHPQSAAEFACARCHALMCRTCDFVMPDGSHLCPQCASAAQRAEGNPFAPPRADSTPFAASAHEWESPGPAPYLAGVCCPRHPETAAVARCKACGKAVCATCDFQFPGGLHFCPECATATSRPLSSGRKTMITFSMLAAGWVTFMLALLLTGTLADFASNEAGAQLLGMTIMIPALLGIALSWGSLDRRAGNPPIIWGAAIWNAVLNIIWLILCLIGLTMR